MLSCRDYGAVAANALSIINNIPGLSHTMVLRLQPAGDSLLLQSGVGWKTGMVGQTIFDTNTNTLMGFALSSTEPVIIENLRAESRFPIPAPLLDHGLVSGVCMRIPCQYQSFGILAAFTTERRSFSHDELSCLRVVAGMLAVTGGCQRTGEVRREDQDKIAQAKQEWESTVDALPHFICLLDENRRIVRANRSVEKWITGIVGNVRGHTVHELLHPGCDDSSCYMTTLCDVAWDTLLNGRYVEYEIEDKVLKRYLSIQLRTISRRPESELKQSSLAVVVLQDITKIKYAEAVLKNHNEQLEHLIHARTAEVVATNEQLKREIVERGRIEEELRHSENEMRLMSVQLLTAQEMERKRIASELHDGIGQSLSAIKFCVETLCSHDNPRLGDQDINQAQNIISRIQGAIDEVRRISMDLRPSTLDDLGIIPTIVWFCREFRSIYSGIRLDTHIDVGENDVSVPLKTAVYRIMQEALNNIIKHARANHARIYLRKTAAMIELRVEDDGAGFDVAALNQRKESDRGFGITGMRERTEFTGGTFFISSKRRTGTTILATWPC